VVFGPAAVELFFENERRPEDFYLFFGQITAYKRLDIAVEACLHLGRKLLIAGSGAKKKDIRRAEKTGLVRFLGRVSDDEAASLFSRARALLYPGIEDMGLIPIEANAAGCPVIAFREGGVLDTLREGLTGMFFDEQTPASLAKTIEEFEKTESRFQDRAAFREHTEQFSKAAFIKRVQTIIDERKRV
jgi:glycosyltransferase involved in cell wall biosynthesis